MGVEGIRENIGRWLGVWRGREEVRVGDEERGGEKREERRERDFFNSTFE